MFLLGMTFCRCLRRMSSVFVGSAPWKTLQAFHTSEMWRSAVDHPVPHLMFPEVVQGLCVDSTDRPRKYALGHEDSADPTVRHELNHGRIILGRKCISLEIGKS